MGANFETLTSGLIVGLSVIIAAWFGLVWTLSDSSGPKRK